MSYRKDGLTRGITDTIRMAGIILLGGLQDKFKQPKFLENGAQEEWSRKLLRMIDEGKINEAENELLEKIEIDKEAGMLDRITLELALGVYEYLNEKDDSFLDENGYSREEILEGVREILAAGGIDLSDMGDTFLGI